MQGIQPARNLAESPKGEVPDFPSTPALVSTDGSIAFSSNSAFSPGLPEWQPGRIRRQAPAIVRINRLLRTILVTFCGVALLGYGLDVAASSEVGKLQEQARRLSEQNTELSAQLLRAISFQGIQANVVVRAGLRVPEHVLIVREIQPRAVKPFKPTKYYLPLIAGY